MINNRISLVDETPPIKTTVPQYSTPSLFNSNEVVLWVAGGAFLLYLLFKKK